MYTPKCFFSEGNKMIIRNYRILYFQTNLFFWNPPVCKMFLCFSGENGFGAKFLACGRVIEIHKISRYHQQSGYRVLRCFTGVTVLFTVTSKKSLASQATLGGAVTWEAWLCIDALFQVLLGMPGGTCQING